MIFAIEIYVFTFITDDFGSVKLHCQREVFMVQYQLDQTSEI